MPPVIRLIQADDVDAWQRVLLALSLPGVSEGARDAGATAPPIEPPLVIVPGRAAAEQWRRTLDRRVLVEHWQPPVALQRALEHRVRPPSSSLAMPRLVSRDDAYETWHHEARIDLPRVSALTREVLMAAGARRA